MAIASKTLYLVATPIGNREDITLRALRILAEVDCIAAEDTRHSGSLLKHFEIVTPMLSYHTHNRARRTPELLQRLNDGQAIALISDAGMPGISDPGVELVQACIDADVAIVPVPGPTACITGLVASGLPTERFVFEGFLPASGKARQQALNQLTAEPRTMVMYEAPHRVLKTLGDLQIVLGSDRPVAIGRELTKRYEEFWRGSLAAAKAHFSQISPKGEFTIVVAGAVASPTEVTEAEIIALLQQLVARGLSKSQASRQVAKQTGGDRRSIYQIAVSLSDLESEN